MMDLIQIMMMVDLVVDLIQIIMMVDLVVDLAVMKKIVVEINEVIVGVLINIRGAWLQM